MQDKTRATLQAISAYVPYSAAIQAMPGLDQAKRVEAVLLFADVSGFTAMSESLARLGKRGAEELTHVLNTYYSAMIDLVQSYGGQVIKFGGDAITCAFLSSGELDDLRARILRACACALAMQAKTAEFKAMRTGAGTFELRMKIGVSAGTVLSLVLGQQQEGTEYVLVGRPLDRVADAEHHATAGEVVLDGACIAGLAACGLDREPSEADKMCWDDLGIVVDDEHKEFPKVRELRAGVEPQELIQSASDAAQRMRWETWSEEQARQAITRLIPYLPPVVYEQIVEGQRQFVGEHRWVVSLFVNFFGLDYDDDPQVAQKLQRYFVSMQEIIHRYGGRLNRVSSGDKGSMLHLIFGAPMAYEDKEKRAVGCALEMQQKVRQADELSFIMDQRIGVASGYAFAGNVGSEQRREYTVMGNTVNLSARLMQAAGPGEVWLDWYTTRRIQADFVCEALTPTRFKGFSKAITPYRAVGARTEAKVWSGDGTLARRQAFPIVGRERELAQIRKIIEQAAAGQGQLLAISGEAGVGKRRLLEELVALARARGVYGLGGECVSFGTQTPYLPWIDLFNSFFGLGAADPAAKMEKITARMTQADPALRDWAPLMGQLLGLATPDNELTASLEAQLRKQRVFDITLTLLRHQAQLAPLFLIVFDDVQWIDSISLEMLHHVARNIAQQRILLVALHRPSIELTQWEQYGYYNHIKLGALSAEDALELVRLKLGMVELPPQLRQLLLRGEEQINPFFVEEVVNSLIDRGYLVPQETGEGYALVGDLSQVDIPDSIQALVMSRVDRLDESSRLTIKVASVIGRVFRYRALRETYPVEITAEKLKGNLDKLDRLNLTPLEKPAPDWEYSFKQLMTQEVTYESLLYIHRRELHQRLGEYLEQTYSDRLEEYYELLAHHFYQSGDREKSWQYLVRAGDKARGQYANETAIAHYQQALSLNLYTQDRPLVHESLGDVYCLIGQYESAVENYRQTLDYHPPTVQVAEVWRKIAKTQELQGQYDEALRYLDLARLALGQDQESLHTARVYNDMGWLAMLRGEYERALQLCSRGLTVAESLAHDQDSHHVQEELQHNLGTIYMRTGDYAQAIAHFQKCIEMRQESGDIYQMGRSFLNLAVTYWRQSDLDLADRFINESLKMFQKVGYTHGTAMCYNNLGVLHYTLGNYERAIERYESSLELRMEIGDAQGIADVYNNLGEVHHSLGNHSQALQYLQEAAQRFTTLGDKMTLIDTYKLLAEVELELKDVDAALEHCQRSLEIAQEIGSREYEGVAFRVLGHIHRVSGRPGAAQHLQNSVETLLNTENRLELGKSYYELGLALQATGEPGAREHLQQALQIFQDLSVEAELEKARAALRH